VQCTLEAAEAGAARIEGAHHGHGLHEFHDGSRHPFTRRVVARRHVLAAVHDDTQYHEAHHWHRQRHQRHPPVQPQQRQQRHQWCGIGTSEQRRGIRHESVQRMHVVIDHLGQLACPLRLNHAQR
jgi:hypothetical protein